MTLFYELIQVALGNRTALSRTPSEAEWYDLYNMCQKQSVVGVAFDALECLNRLRHQSHIGRAVGGMQQSLCAMRYFPIEATWKLILKVI